MALKSMLSSKTKVITERDALIDLIRGWKSCKNLWDDSSRLVPKVEKDKSWQYLLQLYRRVEPNADLAQLKNKLGGLRDVYKRERKKVLKAREQGIQRWPSLWYYDLLRFLDKPGEDDDIPDNLKDPLTETSESSFTYDSANIIYKQESTFYESDGEEKAYIQLPSDDDEPVAKIKKISTEKPSTSTSQKYRKPIAEEIVYGQNLGLQLQELENEQKIIAEKLISDVIFYARLNKLTINSSVTLG